MADFLGFSRTSSPTGLRPGLPVSGEIPARASVPRLRKSRATRHSTRSPYHQRCFQRPNTVDDWITRDFANAKDRPSANPDAVFADLSRRRASFCRIAYVEGDAPLNLAPWPSRPEFAPKLNRRRGAISRSFANPNLAVFDPGLLALGHSPGSRIAPANFRTFRARRRCFYSQIGVLFPGLSVTARLVLGPELFGAAPRKPTAGKPPGSPPAGAAPLSRFSAAPLRG